MRKLENGKAIAVSMRAASYKSCTRGSVPVEVEGSSYGVGPAKMVPCAPERMRSMALFRVLSRGMDQSMTPVWRWYRMTNSSPMPT